MNKENNGWISVEDRLPAIETDVLGLCNVLGKELILIVCLELADDECYFVAINHNGPDYENAIDVTHWQPLPEPPKDNQ